MTFCPRALVSALITSAVLFSACGPRAPLRVETLQLGRSLNSDNSVSAHTTRFKPDETVYVAALTTLPGRGTVTARWLYGGRVISEEQKTVSYRREAATEFHIQYAGGFPVGDYRVEVLMNGESVGMREFKVAN